MENRDKDRNQDRQPPAGRPDEADREALEAELDYFEEIYEANLERGERVITAGVVPAGGLAHTKEEAMAATAAQQVKPGTYWYTTWGYDETHIDFCVVESVSPSGKTAVCRMAEPVYLARGGPAEHVTPGEAVGERFRLRVKSEAGELVLRGSYPDFRGRILKGFIRSFRPTAFGQEHCQTGWGYGH